MFSGSEYNQLSTKRFCQKQTTQGLKCDSTGTTDIKLNDLFTFFTNLPQECNDVFDRFTSSMFVLYFDGFGLHQLAVGCKFDRVGAVVGNVVLLRSEEDVELSLAACFPFVGGGTSGGVWIAGGFDGGGGGIRLCLKDGQGRSREEIRLVVRKIVEHFAKSFVLSVEGVPSFTAGELHVVVVMVRELLTVGIFSDPLSSILFVPDPKIDSGRRHLRKLIQAEGIAAGLFHCGNKQPGERRCGCR